MSARPYRIYLASLISIMLCIIISLYLYRFLVKNKSYRQENLQTPKIARAISSELIVDSSKPNENSPALVLGDYKSISDDILRATYPSDFKRFKNLIDDKIKQWEGITEPQYSGLWENFFESALSQLFNQKKPSEWLNFLEEIYTGYGKKSLSGYESLAECLMKKIVSQIITNNTQSDFLSLQISSVQSRILLGELKGNLLTADPKSALLNLEKVDPNLRPQAEKVVLENLAYKDSEQALRYFLSDQSKSAFDEGTLIQLIGNKSFDDPESTSKILAESKPSLHRDWAIAQMVDKIAFDQPDAALIWTKEISDKKAREFALRQLIAPRNYKEPNRTDLDIKALLKGEK
jgi:hypothetical protein